MDECKASKCSFLSRIKLGEFGPSLLVNNSLYKQLVGILLYFTHFWPNFEYFIGIISRYMQKPHEIHWKDSKRILHYVQGTRHFRVHYVAGFPLELVGFTDSNWVGDPIEKKSTSCYVFMLSHGSICYSSKKQHTISLSLAEVE